MKKVLVPLAEGFEEIEAISIIDVLRRAGIEVVVTSVTGQISVKGSHLITVITDVLIEKADVEQMDMIVLPGGMPGSKNLYNHQGLQKIILQFHKTDKLLGAICAAPMVFGQMGLLNKAEVTCYPGFEKYLTGANLTGKAVTVSGNIITGKGAGVAIQFALRIVEILIGKQQADELASKLMLDS